MESCTDPAIGFLVPGFGLLAAGFGFRVSGIRRIEVNRRIAKDPGFGVSGSDVRVSGF